MSKDRKIFVVLLLALALSVNPLSVAAEHFIEDNLNSKRQPPDPAVMIVDLIVVRPLGLVATIGGSVFFILSSPFSALGGNTEDAWNSMVTTPAEFTFRRPLGEFD